MTDQSSPTIIWLRRDLRLLDHAAFCAAGPGPVIPVFILDPVFQAEGAAARMRLGLSLAVLARDLEARGSQLVLRRGDALSCLRDLVAETGARCVRWSRLYDPASRARDTRVKAALREEGVEAVSHAGHLLHEPWQIETKTGGYYKVFTPFWRAMPRDPAPLSAVPSLPAPDQWPLSDALGSWGLGADMRRAEPALRAACCVGEAAAEARLDDFLARLGGYAQGRDEIARAATSGLAENLTYGEISPQRIWWRVIEAQTQGATGAEPFLRQLAWRDFAYHLLYHTPHITERAWRPEWEGFPWQSEPDERFERWCAGQTGEPLVDAGMRQLWVSGVMHNRVRMIVASYLTKHLMLDWRLGMAWFADQLIDWDPASNALGWQWVAGCGPDAAPFFRIFNPASQAEKFDASGAYRRRYLAEGQSAPPDEARRYYEVIPRSWPYRPDVSPAPLVTLSEGRARALEAYETLRRG